MSHECCHPSDIPCTTYTPTIYRVSLVPACRWDMMSNVTYRNVTLFHKCSQHFIDLIDVITSKNKWEGVLSIIDLLNQRHTFLVKWLYRFLYSTECILPRSIYHRKISKKIHKSNLKPYIRIDYKIIFYFISSIHGYRKGRRGEVSTISTYDINWSKLIEKWQKFPIH